MGEWRKESARGRLITSSSSQCSKGLAVDRTVFQSYTLIKSYLNMSSDEVKADCSTEANSMNSNNLEDAECTASREVSAIEVVDVEAGISNIEEQETDGQPDQDDLHDQADQDSPVPDQPHIEQLSLEQVSKDGPDIKSSNGAHKK